MIKSTPFNIETMKPRWSLVVAFLGASFTLGSGAASALTADQVEFRDPQGLLCVDPEPQPGGLVSCTVGDTVYTLVSVEEEQTDTDPPGLIDTIRVSIETRLDSSGLPPQAPTIRLFDLEPRTEPIRFVEEVTNIGVAGDLDWEQWAQVAIPVHYLPALYSFIPIVWFTPPESIAWTELAWEGPAASGVGEFIELSIIYAAVFDFTSPVSSLIAPGETVTIEKDLEFLLMPDDVCPEFGCESGVTQVSISSFPFATVSSVAGSNASQTSTPAAAFLRALAPALKAARSAIGRGR